MPEDEYTSVVAAILIVDKSIAHHQSELDRNWALRGTLADRLDAMGKTPPPAPQRATAATQVQQDPSESERAAREWLDTLDRTGRSPMPRTPERVWIDPDEMDQDPPEPVWRPPLITTYEQPDRTQRDGTTYCSFLVLTREVPERVEIAVFGDDRFTEVPEAHILTGEPGWAVACGRQGPAQGWWAPSRDEWDKQVEICRPCLRSIMRKP